MQSCGPSNVGETAEVFSGTGDDTELNEGTCNGILKTRGTIDDGRGISIENVVIDSGKHVAY